ncbi:2707_t:CDS:1 [Cetraspora pellucida]|uniref:2707_t:CDS:1 n=1 Tax=Cetraspora pellucida TaxID=1433469 RepID=A0A9N9JFZ2_9GLOM|nr:2707_t:CDS:1 [Cetraspora pellucida]
MDLDTKIENSINHLTNFRNISKFDLKIEEYKNILKETLFLTYVTHQFMKFKQVLYILHGKFPDLYIERYIYFKEINQNIYNLTFQEMDINIDKKLELEKEFNKFQKLYHSLVKK